jgi:hypothetical protein
MRVRAVVWAAILALSLPASAARMAAEVPASADPTPAFAAEARSKIDAVLAAEAFGHIETATGLRAREKHQDQVGEGAALRRALRRVARLLAGIGEAMLWVAALLAVYLLVHHRRRWLPFLGFWRRPREAEPTGTAIRVTPAEGPLPDDIPGQGLELWRAGRHREALGLLYRGAVARGDARFELHLPKGATEGDVLRAIARSAPAARDYYAALTGAWIALAYAGGAPEAIGSAIDPLAAGFRRHLEET